VGRSTITTWDPEMTGEELSGLREWIQAGELKGKHLEIGTAAGGTLCFLMRLYPSPEARPKFVVVDTMSYFANQLEVVKQNLANHNQSADAVDFRAMSSAEALGNAVTSGERFDFILVDASHKIRHVMADLRWLRLLNVGGLACFHDYSPKFKGVQWPLDRFLKRNDQFSRQGQAGSLLCIRRDAVSSRAEVTGWDRIWARGWAMFFQLGASLSKRTNRLKRAAVKSGEG
jgi:hypothetical protein